MRVEATRVRHNYPAIAVAAVACFLFEAAWYTIFLDVWLAGIGHDRIWLERMGVNPLLQWGVALAAEVLIAASLSYLTQVTGEQTARHGVRAAVMLWVGFVLPTTAVAEVFAVRNYASFAVNAGFWLVGMVLMGAIVGAWKKKA